jgi:hypothetical protein
VARLTLDRYAACEGFHDPVRRTAVLASVARIARWCEESISLQHRKEYRGLVTALTRLVDPVWFHLPDPPAELAALLAPATWLRDIRHGPA